MYIKILNNKKDYNIILFSKTIKDKFESYNNNKKVPSTIIKNIEDNLTKYIIGSCNFQTECWEVNVEYMPDVTLNDGIHGIGNNTAKFIDIGKETPKMKPEIIKEINKLGKFILEKLNEYEIDTIYSL